MFLSSRHEMLVLLGTFAGGMVLGVVFDFFRIMRKNFKGASSAVWLQDILMWTVALGVVCATLFMTNSGQIRWYEFLGLGTGLAVYILALSNFVISVSTGIISFFKKVLSLFVKVLIVPVGFVVKIVAVPVKIVIKWMKKPLRRVKLLKIRISTKFHKFFKKN